MRAIWSARWRCWSARRASRIRRLLARAYLLATRAELRERSGDLEGAIVDYCEALKLAPHDDSIRAALADALAARGDSEKRANCWPSTNPVSPCWCAAPRCPKARGATS